MAVRALLRRAGVAPVAAAVSISVGFLLLAGGASGAAKASYPGAVTISARPAHSHAAGHVSGRLGATLASKGKSYLYADDGTYTSNTDAIDVYSVSGTTLTHIQNVTAGVVGLTYYYGTHHLAVVKSPADCLIFSSAGNGTVYSFTISAKTGMLSSSPVSLAVVGGYPGDLAVSGSTVFESNSNYHSSSPSIDVLSVGPHCGLARVSQNSTGSEKDIDLAVANATTVVSTDQVSGDMVAYKLKKSGKLVEAVKNPGQITKPQSVATMHTKAALDVFTGQAATGPPQAQGFSFSGTAFKALKGSPQTSGSATSNGAAVAASAANHLLAQANIFSHTVGWYNLAGKMSYTNAAALATTDGPSALTILGNNLLVPMVFNGDLESCALAPNSVSGCHTVATLTGGTGDFGSTVAVLTVVTKKK